VTTRIVQLFPLWAIGLSIVAYLFPAPFADLKAAIIPLLALVMFGMGMTLTWHHFKEAIKQPSIIAIAVLIQFLFMPLAAFLIAGLLQLSEAQTIGMVLVGSSAGGTASNVICYLAKGNVALSILLTMTSTVAAVLATPALNWLYLSRSVPVPFCNMLASIAQIVLLPVVLGTAINSAFNQAVGRIRDLLPLLSIGAIALIIAIIVALNRAEIATAGIVICLAVALHNLAGLSVGYLVPKLLKYDRTTCRTVSIEVGMQNSGLSVALAVKYFPATAALPGAMFSIWHNLSGSLLAAIWGRERLLEK
jgi:bile acid:Na+ symporter, BASS family